jgi:urease accessory protein
MNVRLLQLASPALPVGAYSYSQGLEAAVESRIVRDAASAEAWISDVMDLTLATLEAPIFLRLARAWCSGDDAQAALWNAEFVASRESAELRAETVQMGHSLRILLRDLEVEAIARLEAIDEPAFPTAFAYAVSAWRLDTSEALEAYLFAWIENQVMAGDQAVAAGTDAGPAHPRPPRRAHWRDRGARRGRARTRTSSISRPAWRSPRPGNENPVQPDLPFLTRGRRCLARGGLLRCERRERPGAHVRGV